MTKLMLGVALASLVALPCVAQSYDPDPAIRTGLIRESYKVAQQPPASAIQRFSGAYAQHVPAAIAGDPDRHIRSSLARENSLSW